MILSMHIFSIEYIGQFFGYGLYNWISNDLSTKNRLFCVFTYREKGNNIFIIVVLLFIFLLYREVQPLNWKYGEVQKCARRFGLHEN